jgi:hypothetical protein
MAISEHKKERHKLYLRERYNNDDEYNKKHRETVRKRMVEIKKWFSEYKSKLKCTYCDENHPACIDFHHKGEKKEKELNIAMAVAKGWSIEHIMREIDKCEPICSNCHRKLHWEEREKR